MDDSTSNPRAAMTAPERDAPDMDVTPERDVEAVARQRFTVAENEGWVIPGCPPWEELK